MSETRRKVGFLDTLFVAAEARMFDYVALNRARRATLPGSTLQPCLKLRKVQLTPDEYHPSPRCTYNLNCIAVFTY